MTATEPVEPTDPVEVEVEVEEVDVGSVEVVEVDSVGSSAAAAVAGSAANRAIANTAAPTRRAPGRDGTVLMRSDNAISPQWASQAWGRIARCPHRRRTPTTGPGSVDGGCVAVTRRLAAPQRAEPGQKDYVA